MFWVFGFNTGALVGGGGEGGVYEVFGKGLGCCRLRKSF